MSENENGSLVRTSGLSLPEAARLKECESVIQNGLDTFYQVGNALAEIRETRLYRAAYTTFEDYCRERWKMSKRHADRLIGSAEVVDSLGPIGPIPSTESQARELAILKEAPELQRAVWQIAVETAPKDSKGEPAITASHIKSVADVMKGIVESGGLDDGSGEVKPLGRLVDAAVTEETYERMMRQKEYIKQHLEERPKPHVSHNSGENEWYTPKEYIEAARKVMGEIDLDPASCKSANVTVGATSYFSRSNDGLAKEWSGRVWMNPPYASDLISKFTAKLTQHYLRDEVQEALVLVNNATDTTWFQDMAQHANAICLLRGRVRFWGPDGHVGAPLQGQVVLYFGANQKEFEGHFEQFGLVVWR